jgi:hypothetical protein
VTLPRLLVPVLAGLALAVSAAAAPLSLGDLIRLADEGVGEKVLLSIAENQGVEGPLNADQVLAMNRAGWSDELMAAVVKAAAAGAPPAAPPASEAVTYEERDGTVVARLHGEPGDSGAPEREGPAPAVREPQSAPPVVVVQAPPAPVPTEAPARWVPEDYVPGYPVGASYGWSGSTVFLPAHFGGSTPSSFGRTIVSTGGGPTYGALYAPPSAAYGYAGPVVAAPQPSTTTIRTSRGLRQVPN